MSSTEAPENKTSVESGTFEESPESESQQPRGAALAERMKYKVRRLGTREAWLGPFGFGELFMPRWDPYNWFGSWRKEDEKQKEEMEVPFYPVNGEMPIILGAISGLQHCLAMLAGLITPPIVLSSSLNLDPEISSYLVSASLITSGILSLVQITRIPLVKGYQLGTGILSVVGTSFATLSSSNAVINNMYSDGTCPVVNGKRQPCPDGYGYLLGTAALCSVLEILLSLVPIRVLQRLFPRVVTGVVILLIGVAQIGESGVLNWGGGSSGCNSRSEGGAATPCQDPRGLPWGSPEYLGLGFLAFFVILVVEIFGSPVMRCASVVIGLLFPLVVAGPTGYLGRENIDAAKPITFLWVHTFKLRIYPQAILPFLAVYISLAMEAIGDVTASSEASRLSTTGPEFESRIQGGIMADAMNGWLSALFTITPMSVFAQNNAIIALTQIASRQSGYWCCFWLILFGILGKIAGCIRAIPSSVIGGVTSFLFMSVAVSGLSVLSKVPINRRNRFVLTSSLMFGFGTMLVKKWFAFLFTYSGPNRALKGFLESLEIVLETPFLLAGLVAMVVNLILPYEHGEREAEEQMHRLEVIAGEPELFSSGADKAFVEQHDWRPEQREQRLD